MDGGRLAGGRLSNLDRRLSNQVWAMTTSGGCKTRVSTARMSGFCVCAGPVGGVRNPSLACSRVKIATSTIGHFVLFSALTGHFGDFASYRAHGTTTACPVDVKLLVLEDDLKLARFLVRAFQEDGWVVDTCSRGQDALARARLGIYEALVLDWNVPEMDGLSVCRELRRVGHRIPIVMLTARHDTPERVLALDAGADDYVPKPFEIDELMARVRAVVRRAQSTNIIRCGEL